LDSRDGEFIPVILSPVRKAISNEPQVTKKKKKVKTLGFDAAEIKVKPRDAEIEISVKSRESEVCIQEFAPNQISEEQEEGAVRFRICSNARCHICSYPLLYRGAEKATVDGFSLVFILIYIFIYVCCELIV
jgi:hypothetical protein